MHASLTKGPIIRRDEKPELQIQASPDRGVVFRGDVVDDTQLLIANFQDPDGNPFYLAEPKGEYQREPQPASTAKS
jgi:hypothetical protein